MRNAFGIALPNVSPAIVQTPMSRSILSATFEPFTGIAYVHHSTDRFAENGGLAALHAAADEEDVVYSTLGLRMAGRLQFGGLVVAPRLSLAWQHAFGDVTPSAFTAFDTGGAGFEIDGAPIARDSALVEVGLDLNLGADVALGISYAGQLAEAAEDHAVSGQFRWRF